MWNNLVRGLQRNSEFSFRETSSHGFELHFGKTLVNSLKDVTGQERMEGGKKSKSTKNRD